MRTSARGSGSRACGIAVGLGAVLASGAVACGARSDLLDELTQVETIAPRDGGRIEEDSSIVKPPDAGLRDTGGHADAGGGLDATSRRDAHGGMLDATEKRDVGAMPDAKERRDVVATMDAAGLDATGGDARSVDAGGRDAYVCDVDCTPATIAAPRPIAPLSTATATSQTPMLRWSLPSGEDGAEVAIYRDRACTEEVVTFAASGSSGVTPIALARGVYFWQLRGMAKGVVGTPTSPVWELFVGGRSAPVNNSWGTTLDVDGDGIPEVLVGALAFNGDEGAAYLFQGTSGGLSQTPTMIASPAGMDGLFGSAVASAGDVNGDGYVDVVIGARAVGGQGSVGAAFVYLGGSGGLSAIPTKLPGPTTTNSQFGGTVASAGDVNGDGYADVVIGAFNAETADLFLGGPTGISTTPIPLAGPGSGLFGVSVASAGDINGDGYADILVGANQLGAGVAYLFLGSSNGPSTAPIVISSPVPQKLTLVNFGFAVGSAGDVNGDGLADVVIGALGAGATFVYLGSADGTLGAPITLGTGGMQVAFMGESVGSAGDVNGDGFGDVIVADGANNVGGGVFVYLGGPQGLSTTPASFGSVGGSLGTTVAGVGDVDGDGFDDVVSGAPWGDNGVGLAAVLFGGPTGFSTRSLTLGPGGMYGQFGGSVAIAAPRRGRPGGSSWWPILDVTRGHG